MCPQHQLRSPPSPSTTTNPPRCLCQCAERELGLWREEPQGALKAGGDAWQDDTRMAPEALSASIHQGLDG